MKKILLLALFTGLSASPLWADEITSEPDQFGPNQRWIERVEGTLGFPASSDTSASLNTGFGGGLSFGYRVDPHFSISIASGYYQYDVKSMPATNTTGGFLSYVPLETVFSYNFGGGSFRPYASFGIGAAFNTYTSSLGPLQTNSYETSFFMSPAVGLLAVISPKAALFLEGRIDMDYRANNALGIANGTPSVFIPIQAGLTFFVI